MCFEGGERSMWGEDAERICILDPKMILWRLYQEKMHKRKNTENLWEEQQI